MLPLLREDQCRGIQNGGTLMENNWGTLHKWGIPRMDGLSWKTLFKWMLEGYPHLWKPPTGFLECVTCIYLGIPVELAWILPTHELGQCDMEHGLPLVNRSSFRFVLPMKTVKSWVSIVMGVITPKWMVYFMENPLNPHMRQTQVGPQVSCWFLLELTLW